MARTARSMTAKLMMRSVPKSLPFKCVVNTIKSGRQSMQKQSPTKTKRVQFAPTKNVANLHRSQEDLSKSWYVDSEYTAFDQERKRTVAALHEVNGELRCLDPTEYTVSGLEHHLCRQLMIARKVKTMRHVRSVLKQQHSNRCTGVNDPESLRSVSEFFSTQPSKRAHLRGVLDHTLNIMW